MAGSESVGSVWVDVVPKIDVEGMLRSLVREVVREELLRVFELPVLSVDAVRQLFAADDPKLAGCGRECEAPVLSVEDAFKLAGVDYDAAKQGRFALTDTPE